MLQCIPHPWGPLAYSGDDAVALRAQPLGFWIERLALTPRFDERAGRAAFSAQGSPAQDAAWETLGAYSFIQAMPGPHGWYALRAQMRWALENQPSAQERVAADHRWWGSPMRRAGPSRRACRSTSACCAGGTRWGCWIRLLLRSNPPERATAWEWSFGGHRLGTARRTCGEPSNATRPRCGSTPSRVSRKAGPRRRTTGCEQEFVRTLDSRGTEGGHFS